MDIKTILKKYLVFVIGLYFLAAGIVLIIHSTLGTTPISSVNYVLSLNSPLSLGTCTFIVNVLLILGQFWLIRGTKSRQDQISILLQIPFSFIFSAFIDFNMALTEDLYPSNYIMSIALLLLGSHPVYRCRIRDQAPGCDDECRRIRQLRRPPLQ